jgi:predicted Zn-dependent peptidase
MVSTILSGGGSSRLSTKMVDEKKTALQVAAFNYTLEDHGAYITLALPNNNTPLNDLLTDIDAEVVRLQTDLISESEFKKLQNQFENGYVSANTKMIGVAENLSNGYTFHNKNTNDLNEQLAQIKSITREEIRDVARKYLNKDQRVVLYYLPKK